MKQLAFYSTPKYQYRDHKRLPRVPVLSQINPLHVPPSSYFLLFIIIIIIIIIIITIPSTPRSSKPVFLSLCETAAR